MVSTVIEVVFDFAKALFGHNLLLMHYLITWTNLPPQIFGPDILSLIHFLPDLLVFNQQNFEDITNVQNLHSG